MLRFRSYSKRSQNQNIKNIGNEILVDNDYRLDNHIVKTDRYSKCSDFKDAYQMKNDYLKLLNQISGFYPKSPKKVSK